MTFPLQWYLLFLISIPQALIVIMLGLAAFNLYLPWKKMLIIAFINGTFSYFIRFIPMVFGIHSIIDISLFAAMATIIGQIRFLYALCAMTAGLVVLGVLESCIISVVFYIADVSIETLIGNQWYLVMISFSQIIVMGCLYWLIKKFDLKMWDLNVR